MVLLAPCYIGYKHDRGEGLSPRLDGWNDEIVATGPEGCRVYGEYLGRRFGRFANIVWMIGGDWHPDEARSGPRRDRRRHPQRRREEPLHRPSASGVLADRVLRRLGLARCQRHLHLRHRAPLAYRRLAAQSAVAVLPDRIDLRGRAQRQPISRSAGRPTGRCFAAATATAWATTRSGCSGTAGEQALDLPGSVAMARWGGFFRALPWSELVPDLELELVSAGPRRGARARPRHGGDDRRPIVSASPICRCARPVGSASFGALKGPRVAVEWFEPASGRRLSGGTLAGEGAVTLAPPFEEDAVLVLTSVRVSEATRRHTAAQIEDWPPSTTSVVPMQ